ncbi:MAG: hypothetical protein IMY67_13055 [Bacteroidetes bacterium]|nr:hypothetical protein [Bacteroidota bacterium]
MKAKEVAEQVNETVTPQMSDALQILEKVNAFYSDAFNHLLYTMSGMIALVGLVVPLIFTFYQNRKLKVEKESLERYVVGIKYELKNSIQEKIKSEIENEKEMLGAALEQSKKELDKAIEKNKKEIDEEIHIAKGSSLFLQGNNLYDKYEYNEAAESYIYAIEHFIDGKDESNLQRALDNLTNRVFPEMDKSVLEDFPKIQSDIEGIVKGLNKLNENRRYTDVISDLEKTINQVLKRTPKEK